MSDEQQSTPPSATVVDMPWLLLSNQIQQLSSSLSDRFSDQRAYFEQRFSDQRAYFEQRFQQIDQRFDDERAYVDQRFEQVDRRFERIDQQLERIDQQIRQVEHGFQDGLARLEGKLGFRVNIWVMIAVSVLSVGLGAMASHTRW